MKKFIALATLLFDMELESIGNDAEFHWAFNSWHEKFGENSIMMESKLEKKDNDINDLAKLLKKDFDNKEFEADKEGQLYNYMMPTLYGGFIVDRLELQLADLTKVGTQLSFF